MLNRKRGQSILEYVIILTAIIAAIILAVTTLGQKDNTGGLGKLMDQAGKRIQTETNNIANIVP